MKELLLGGVRSGKSALAEHLAEVSAKPVVYIATAEVGDAEIAARIEAHRQRRPEQWGLIEEPIRLAAVLSEQAAADRCLLVDCLTLWLTNLLCAEDEAQLVRERDALLELMPKLPGRIIMVSNEVGQGIVPMNPLARRFVDEAGRLHQMLAPRCDRVIFTVAGLPHVLKGEPL